MTVEVCTVWAPRPGHPMWRDDYLRLVALQRQTALRAGATHVVVTDAKDLPGFDVMCVALGADVMQAMIDGVIARLRAPVATHIVFVDLDVLIGRPLDAAFGDFDLGLTRRANALAPVNNGAMYVHRDGAARALRFFERARELCGTHWGADQEAISQTAAPVPDTEGFGERYGARVAFLSMADYNCIPKTRGKKHTREPFAIHFKGATKDWAAQYAGLFLLT